jgi:hypothetical protein
MIHTGLKHEDETPLEYQYPLTKTMKTDIFHGWISVGREVGIRKG